MALSIISWLFTRMNDLKIEIDAELVEKALKEAPGLAKKMIALSLSESALEVQNKAKSPGYAPYDKGTLRRSITHEVKPLEAKVGTNLVYAPIHEFGGTIRAKKAKYLRFKVNGQWVSKKQVTIKPYNGRGYLRPALKDSSKYIIDTFNKNLKKIFP